MPRGMKQHALTALGRRNAPAHPANAGFKDGVTPMVNFAILRCPSSVRQDFFLEIAATWRRCDGGHGTRRHMVVGQRGHRSMVARGLSHRRAALRLVGWPRLRPRSQLPPAFEQLALGLTLPR